MADPYGASADIAVRVVHLGHAFVKVKNGNDAAFLEPMHPLA